MNKAEDPESGKYNRAHIETDDGGYAYDVYANPRTRMVHVDFSQSIYIIRL